MPRPQSRLGYTLIFGLPSVLLAVTIMFMIVSK